MIPNVKPQQLITVEEQDRGQRLDVYLARALGVSRGYVRRLLGRERVRVGEKPALKGVILRAGDRIEVLPFQHPDEGPPPSPQIPITLLGEGDGLLAIDKPAGMPTHPLDFEETDTVLNALLARYPELNGVGEGGLRSGVLHRLDTYTSGVLLFATRDEVWQRVRSEFAERRVQKRYVARVHGSFRGEPDVVLHLSHRGARMRVVERGGRESVTRLRPLREIGDTTLLEARPVTGLMHQIRVTLAHLGHPILGDRLYGSPMELGRHLLHASFIAAADFEAASPLPEIFEQADHSI